MSSSTRFLRTRFQPRFLLVLLMASALAVGLIWKSGPFDRAAHASTTAAFTPGNLVIYRVGDGSAALTANATAVFLDEYTTTPAAAPVQTIPLPTTVNAANKRLTASGLSTSEGLMTLSTDGQYLTASGYDTATGTATITSSASTTINRVIGRISAAGTVDTTTALSDAISGGNPRGTVSTNGTDLWISGTSTGGGIRYATLGSTTSTSLSTAPTNIRATNIFGGQLYVSSASGSFRLAMVGSGTPTTSGQTITNLAGITTGSPYAFFFADLNPGVAGVDTLYLADDTATTGGIQKYSLVGGTWTSNGIVVSDAVRGLTGVVNGPSSVTLYVTSANATTLVSRLSTLTDTAGYNVANNGTVTTVATAPANMAFRGVAFVPTTSATPTLNINDVTLAEGDTGQTAFNFNVSLTSPAGVGGVTFNASTADGTTNPANAGTDYVALTNQPFTIAQGQSSTTVTVMVNGDMTDELAETFFVNLSSVTGATSGDLTGLGTITNDDGPPALSINDVAQAEGNAGTTSFTFTVSLNKAAQAGGVSFTVNTADGTTSPATAGSDYVAIVGGSGSIAVGNNSTPVTVTVNGDMTTEPNETFFVNLTGVTGATVTDGQGLGTIQNDDVATIPIYTIQGSTNASPFIGSSVTTTGIVTARRTNGASNFGFYIQDPTGDGNANTSDALLVFTGSTTPTVAIGDSVQVTGTISEFIATTSDEPRTASDPRTATEMTGPTIVTLSTGNGLPAPIDVVSANVFNPASPSRAAELEKYEYMRLSVPSLTVSEPTNTFGEFWGVVTGTARPFREPGLEAGDPIPVADTGPFAGGTPPNVPVFDGNFERIMVDSGASLTAAGVRRAQIQLNFGAVVTNIVGPLDYSFDNYRIVLDATATPGTSGGVTAFTPVPARTATEFTVASANLQNFGVSNTNFADRLNKASLAIRNVMLTPDILGIIECFDLATLQQVATKVNNDFGNTSVVNYTAYLDEGIDGAGDDQDIGYLVNTVRVTVVGSPVQLLKGKTWTFNGVTSVLHDRPSYILNATIPQTSGPALPITVILNHTKSLIAVDSPLPYSGGPPTEGARNREKRRLQAEDIADYIQAHQSEYLVVLGDLNAFQFNDGLGDVVGTLSGTPPPPDQVVEPSTPDRWTYTLFDSINRADQPASERYSFTFEGNAQALDHVLVNTRMLLRQTRFAYGRYNGDFNGSLGTDPSRPERLSDHDAAVSYFSAAPTAANGVVSGRLTDPNGVPIAGAVVTLSGTQNRKFITDANGDYRFDNVETNGFYTVRPSRVNFNFTPAERSFSQLGINTEAVFTGSRVAIGVNVIDTPEYFVRQNYLDFLGREPDESGFNFWSDQILSCGADAGCRERHTINVSAAYFLSIEFQQTGGLVDGLYRASYARAPRYAEFMLDTATVARGVVVGRGNWAQLLEANKQAFVDAWVQRADFRAAYDALAHDAFVDTLISHAGYNNGGFNGDRNALISGLNNSTLTRSAVLRQVVENEGFTRAKRNETFVMMEYFGYLRRDPDQSGYQFWLNKLNQFDGNFEQAEMVKAFISSGEYRDRFLR